MEGRQKNVVKSVVFCQTYLEVANSKLFQSLPRLTYLLSFASLFQSKSNIISSSKISFFILLVNVTLLVNYFNFI